MRMNGSEEKLMLDFLKDLVAPFAVACDCCVKLVGVMLLVT